MEERLLTGLTEEDRHKKMSSRNEFPKCYLCKRKAGDESLFVSEDGDLDSWKLALFGIKRDFQGVKFMFHLCQECVMVVGTDCHRSDLELFEGYPDEME